MSDQYSLEDHEEHIRYRGAWEQVLRRLYDEVPANVYERFLSRLRATTLQDGVAVIVAPGGFVYEWVRERYLKKLEEMIGAELGDPVRLELQLEPNERPQVELAKQFAVVAPIKEAEAKFKPNDRYRFESFVVGQSNRLAVAGAKAVSKEPGSKYNPLFIYGASGLGKTHLLHSIAHRLLQRDARYPILYISAQQFAEEFVQALQTNKIEQFRRQQRSFSVWLVDDIQFIAGKERTQEEIFHTFNYLYGLGKQIVLCSDRPPRDLFLMDERLRSRFEAGLVADVQMPDTETRCAIIMSKAQQEEIPLAHEVAMYLAEQVPGNIRILEGALTKLVAQSSLLGGEISIDLATEIVEKYYRTLGMAKPGFEQIVDVVGRHYKIPSGDIKGVSRKAPIAHARHVAVYITREITGDSWKHIGGLFGNRDHTSMMHAYQKISEMVARDKDLNAAVKMLIRNLYPDV